MKTIIEFLNSQIGRITESNETLDSVDKDVEKLNKLLITIDEKVKLTRHHKIQPRIQINQIWTVKHEYENFQGFTQRTSHPLIVIIKTEPDEIDGEYFARSLVISPFIEMANSTDEVCEDQSIIGFPFLIESWNEQPILTELLDEYLGYYEFKSRFSLTTELVESENEINSEYLNWDSNCLPDIKRDFREIEISRAKFINHSVKSLLIFLENKQSQDAGVIVSLFEKIEYPKFYIGQTQKDSKYSLAAKSGIDTEDKYLLFESDSLPFKLIFRKTDDDFIITIESTAKMQLLSNSKQEFFGISNKEKTVFANLKPGIYNLFIEKIEKPLKIRLK